MIAELMVPVIGWHPVGRSKGPQIESQGLQYSRRPQQLGTSIIIWAQQGHSGQRAGQYTQACMGSCC